MPTIRVKIVGSEALQRALERMNPGQNKRIIRNSLVRSALAIQKNAAELQIAAGGRGKKGALPPLPHRLTSRTGALRRSIRVNRGPLPFAIEIGTDLGYGAVHEFGGDVDVPSVIVREHTRKSAFGKRVPEFTVPAHFRTGHSARYPRRPFLEPALNEIAPKFGDIVVEEWKKEAGL